MIFRDMGIFEKAQIDFLTGFFLRESFGQFLEKAMREATATSGVVTLALVDLDHFKNFNDKFGHDFGDEILKYSASTIRLTMDENQTYFFRYGGDEFIVVFAGKTQKEALQLLKYCRHNLLHRPFLLKNKFQKITMSIGVASFPHDAQTVEDLIAKADNAMYYSKRHGRNRITMWSSISHLKARNYFILFGTLAIMVLSTFVAAYVPPIKESIMAFIGNIKELRKVSFDKIVLKSGAVFEGRIVNEDATTIFLQLNLKEGEGSLKLDKSKVSKIIRAKSR